MIYVLDTEDERNRYNEVQYVKVRYRIDEINDKWYK